MMLNDRRISFRTNDDALLSRHLALPDALARILDDLK